MTSLLPRRARTSLRLRLLVATVALVAAALLVAAVAFERVARSVVVEAVHDHLASRAQEVHEAIWRFQHERVLTVRGWSEAEAMQLTLDSGDPKFAEDYLRRSIQDQGGSIEVAALLDTEGVVRAAVRHGDVTDRRGVPLDELLGDEVSFEPLGGAMKKGEINVGLAPRSALLRGGGDRPTLFIAVPIKDFASDLVGAIVAAVDPAAVTALLGEVNGKEGAYQPAVADRALSIVLTVPGADPAAVKPLFGTSIGRAGELERFELPGRDAVLAVRTTPPSETPGWSAAMLLPERAAYGKISWLRGVLALLFALVLLGAGIAGVLAIRQASQPLTDVSTSMARVAAGDLSTRVRAEYTDELGHLVRSFNSMVSEVERSRDELQRTEALRREVQLAHQIQTAILPVSPSAKGFEIAARMKPADDVGGDLYDVLPFDDTFWVVVGDVSGHGINSGLVMMMAQVAAYSAIAEDPHASPREIIAAVNRVVHENVRVRMKRDDYLTLMAARHVGDGRFVAAGAHQPVFIKRRTGAVDVIEPAGPWCGVTPGVPPGVQEYEFRVAPGELVCLITDGVVEATDARGDLFGEERLSSLISGLNGATASQALGTIFSTVEAFASAQSDDMTSVVLRRTA